MRKYYIYIILLFIIPVYKGHTQEQLLPVGKTIVDDKGNYAAKAVPSNNEALIKKVNDDYLRHQSSGKPLKAAMMDIMPHGIAVQGTMQTQYSIDKSKGVGEIPIQQSVANGGLTLSVPIEVYPGRNGFQPSLSLNYNSFSTNGMAGIGWNLGGFSSISLVNYNMYFDGFTSDNKMNQNGTFTLDGNRLVKIGTATNAINYQTELGNIKVTGYLGVDCIKYFEVFYPDGKKATYGDVNNTVSDLSYPVQKMEDLTGNYMEYIYVKEDNMYFLTEIKYGANKTSPDHFASVKIVQQYRSSPRYYTHGLIVRNSKCIESINTYFNGNLLRSYTLSYTASPTQRLTKIECTGNGESLNPLLFYYGDNTATSGFEQINYPNTLDNRYNVDNLYSFKGKFNNQTNNDGIIIYGNTTNYGPKYHQPYRTTYWDTYYPNDHPVLVLPDITKGMQHTQLVTGDGYLGAFTADVDGDGYDEIIRINNDINLQYKEEYITYNTFKVNNNTVELHKSVKVQYSEYIGKFSYDHGTILYSPLPRQHLAGDFLGNGKQQIVRFSYSIFLWGDNGEYEDIGDRSTCTLIDLENGNKLYSSSCFKVGCDDLLFVLDYDGDGKADIGHLQYTIGQVIGALSIYSFNENNQLYNKVYYVSSAGASPDNLLIGDINQDGKTDLLVRTPDIHHPDLWTFLLSDGDGSFDWEYYGLGVHEKGMEYYLQDVNKDGYLDLIRIKDKKEITIKYGLEGIGFFSSETFALNDKLRLVPHNIFQNGLTSSLVAVQQAGIRSIISKQDKSRQNLLTGLINSLGVTSSFEYQNMLIGNSGIYDKGESLNYPLEYPYGIMDGYLNLIKTNKSTLNDNLISSASYKYHRGVFDKRGKGFLGFVKIESTDNLRNTKTTQVFDPKNFGVLRSVDSPTISSTYNYDVAVGSNKIAKITLSNKTEKNKLKGLSKTTAYTYDTYGLPLTEVVDYGGNIKTTTCNLYNNYNTVASYRLGVVKETSIKEERGSDYAITRTVYSDFNSQYLPKIKIEYYKYKADTEMQISQESYIYDAQNNLTQKLIKPYSSTISQTVNYTYDNYGRITSETDPLGLKVSYTYNNTTGLLEKSTNNKGQNTTYSYDAWGRNIKTTYPDGTTESVKTQWAPATGSGIVTDMNTSAGTHIHVLNLSTAGTQGGTITACESISLKPGFSYSSAKSGSLVLKVDPTVHADSPPQYTNVSAVTYLVTATKTGTPMTQAYYDALGREIRTGGMGFDGKYLYTDCQYDNRGRLSKVSQPFKGNAATKWNVYEYDNYDRIISLTNEASGKKDTYTYPLNRNTETSLIDGVSVTKNYDNTGVLSSVSDPGGTISYTYRADGQISNITVPGGIETRFTYDKYGRKETIDDPSAGIRTYVYNSEGNIREERDARGANYITSMTYDSYNRLKTKTADGITTTINYAKGADGKENGLVQSVSENNGISTTYTYDTYDRILSEKRIVADGKSLEKTYSYNGGNISAITYKSNSGNIGTENYLYSYGSLNEIKLGATSIWSLTSENNLGLPTVVKTGNLTRSYGYDASGLVMSRIAKTATGSVIQNLEYNFDPGTMNLKWRKDNTRSALPQENFTYDGLNRLKTSTGKVPITMTYNNSTGNITEHSIVGAFTYGQKDTNNKIKLPYSITGVTPYNSDFSQEKQTVAYNTMMRPSLVTEGLENTDTFMSTTFKYNGDGDRVKMEIWTGKNESPQLVRYYISGQYEQDSGVAGDKERLYLAGDAYSAPAVYVKENGNWQVKYILRDYMGSITHLTDASGKVQEEFSYDPWGRMRNPDDHTLYAAGKEPVPSLGRGYTGHEHLGMHGLINMNARLYDPVVGRFLSPDPYVQAPDFSQNFNRYSYALNNPLKYTDPNGENPFLVFGIGALFGYFANAYHTNDWGWSSVGSGVFVGTGMGTTYAMSGGGNPWVYSSQFISNEILSNVSPLSIGLGDFNLSLSPYSMLTGGIANRAGNGYAFGAGISLGYDDGKTALSINGIGSFRNHRFESKISVGGGYNGYSYYWNYYSGKDAQSTGTLGIQRGKFSLRWENDVLAQSGDKFRSNATEIGWGDFIVGTNVYTTHPGSKDDKDYIKNGSKIFNNINGTYNNGFQLSSPFYVGHKTKYGIHRVGFNNHGIGDLVQNGFHHLKLPFILWGFPAMSSGNFQLGNYSSFYYQSGTYIPGIMY